MQVPTLDFSHLHGSDEERLAFSRALLQGFSEIGFVKIINHGFSEEDISQLFSWNHKFFYLPDDQKLEVANVVSPNPQRGWSGVGVEKTGTLNATGEINLVRVQHGNTTDVKEHFDIGAAGDVEFPNKWPRDSVIPGFRPWLEEYFNRGQQVSLELMNALEVAMNIPSGTFAARCRRHASELRLNHYPAVPIQKLSDGTAKRIWPHTDFGIITLLAQDGHGGLEIQDKNRPGTFVPVPLKQKNELVVNIGDTLERWTNGVLKAGLHQVNLPDELKNDRSIHTLPARSSVAFFLKASRDTSVGAIDNFVPIGDTSKYEEMTALEYHQCRVGIVY
ncbi:putative gibberellin 20-oxidase [Camillea tinctor]|nr:putative gibberellin 20-oxidase [Camillea tinctor]